MTLYYRLSIKTLVVNGLVCFFVASSIMRIVFCCFVLFTLAWSDPIRTAARLCVKTDEEVGKCEALKNSFKQRNLTPGLECVRGEDIYDCMIKVNHHQADLLTGWFMDIYIAGKYHNLKPLLAEKYNNESDWTDSYRILAVINKSDDSIHSLADLRGKKSCHSGVASLGGWLLPSAVLNKQGLLPNNSCYNNLPNLAEFFSQGCAPEANKKAFDPQGKYSNMCALCNGTGDQFCTYKDPYAGYVGALKCLVDGVGDVAFVLDTTWDELVKKNPELADKKNDYELLCLDGSRKSLDENDSCALGKVPPRGLMASPSLTEAQRHAIRDMFLEAQKDLDFFKLFDSSAFGRKDVLFTDRTVALIDPGQKDDYRKYVGDDFLNILENQYPCSVPLARWCTISNAEFNKCLRLRDALAGRIIKPNLNCILAQNTEECLNLIKNSDADLITLDGGDIYTGGKKYGLKPIMYEDQGKNDTLYFAVAVVKKSNTEINFNNLQGKKSCHTGIGRTAGWNVPVGMLLRSGKIQLPPDCDLIKATGEFFNASCAPGALDPIYNPHGTNPPSLCDLCAGTGTNKCTRSNQEPYYGYTGAFRCLVEGGGDVAFVKDSTPLENTEGKNTEDWAKNLKKDDFELLCLDGSRKSVDEYNNCNLAKSSSHAVATGGSHDDSTVDQYLYILNAGQNFYGNKLATGNFRMFASEAGAKDLLFDDATVELKDIPVENRDYRKYLGTLANVLNACE